MPNIEVYGFSGREQEKKIRKLREDLFWTITQVLNKLGLAEEAVVTGIVSFSSYVKDIYGHRGDDNQVLIKKNTPFIRICSTDPEEIQRIIAGLKEAKIGIDIEYLVLAGFIPAEEMR